MAKKSGSYTVPSRSTHPDRIARRRARPGMSEEYGADLLTPPIAR